MITITIFSILIIGIVCMLFNYINKGWIQRHIYKEADPNDDKS